MAGEADVEQAPFRLQETLRRQILLVADAGARGPPERLRIIIYEFAEPRMIQKRGKALTAFVVRLARGPARTSHEQNVELFS